MSVHYGCMVIEEIYKSIYRLTSAKYPAHLQWKAAINSLRIHHDYSDFNWLNFILTGLLYSQQNEKSLSETGEILTTKLFSKRMFWSIFR